MRKNVACRSEKDEMIHDKALHLLEPYGVVGCYVDLPDEVMTTKLIRSLLEQGKVVMIPQTHKEHLSFHPISSLDETVKGVFGVREPVSDEGDISAIEAFIVPLLCFDEEGYRLGYGKGYYDRVLKDHKAVKIGIAYDMQKCAHVPHEEHDIPLDVIISENEIYKRKR